MNTKQAKKERMAAVSFDGKYTGAIGRRKSAIAQVRVYQKGSGKIFVNGLKMEDYFGTEPMRLRVRGPLMTAGMNDTADVSVHVLGGGRRGQADATCLGIARALEKIDEALRPSLKAEGFLRRDARVKERKKPGLKKARRAPQWSKR